MAKALKAKELRGLSATELKQQIEQLRQDLWQKRLKVREGSLQQTHTLQSARRQIARTYTVLSEQKLATPTAKKGN